MDPNLKNFKTCEINYYELYTMKNILYKIYKVISKIYVGTYYTSYKKWKYVFLSSLNNLTRIFSIYVDKSHLVINNS